MNIIKMLEEKHGAVCDSHEIQDGIYILVLRVIRESFEYACQVKTDEKGFILDYKFSAGWHVPMPDKAKVHTPHKITKIAMPKSQIEATATPSTPQARPQVIRRRILTPA